MSNVRLEIGGRQFTVACAEGEEEHVTSLGQMIAAKLQSMGDLSNQNESRMLLFAALLLADELYDSNARAAAARAQPALGPAFSPESARRLETIADRLENLAGRLEG